MGVAAQDSGKTVMVSTLADGTGRCAQTFDPSGIAIDNADNIYVADVYNHNIYKISPKGAMSLFTDGKGSDDQILYPIGIAVDDKTGNLYVVDQGNFRIRKVTSNGAVSTLAGTGGLCCELGGGLLGHYADGAGSVAGFSSPHGIAIDAAGNLYVADAGNNCIRKITPKGDVSTLAGSGEKGFADGSGSTARFNDPVGIAIDAAGNLYVADKSNQRIRKVSPTGDVSTLAGSGEEGFADGAGSVAQFRHPFDITVDKLGNLYVADSGNQRIRKVTPEGDVSTIAGGGQGFADGSGSEAMFNWPYGIAIDAAGNLYVADGYNRRIRKLVFVGRSSPEKE